MGNTEANITCTVLGHLAAQFKFSIPRAALCAKLVDRELDPETVYDDEFKQGEGNKDKFRLAYADIIKWFLLGPSKRNNTSDSDNGWSHAGGGYELDAKDRDLLIKEANAIYGELEPESAIKSRATLRVMSFGIRHASYDPAGNPLPHIIR